MIRLNRLAKILLLLSAVAVLSLAGYAAFAVTGEPGGPGDPLVTQSYVDQYIQWQVQELRPGQILQGKAGAELILRRGQAVVVDTAGNGIPNVTVGKDIFAGETVPLNHLLIIPREDGRGLRAQSQVFVMYRGGATVR